MANTTFKGPVRSQNGFQELVDGVWTPVGGGGGGSAPVVVFRNPSAQTLITLPVPTEIGQVYRYIFPRSDSNVGEPAIITCPSVPGTSGSYLQGTVNLYDIATGNTFALKSNETSSTNAMFVGAEPGLGGEVTDVFADIQIVYIGVYGGYARFQTFNSSYWTYNTTQSRIYTN